MDIKFSHRLSYKQARITVLAGFILGLGTIVFAGDLVARHYLGSRLFPFAAPLGGNLMILGWLAIAIGAFLRAVARR